MGLGCGLGDFLSEVTDNGGVGVEEVITGHAGLAGDTSGDDDDFSAFEGTSEVVCSVALDLFEASPERSAIRTQLDSFVRHSRIFRT